MVKNIKNVNMKVRDAYSKIKENTLGDNKKL